MKNIINAIGINTVDFIQGRKGTYQAIVKVPAGFMSAYEVGTELPSLNRWKKGALQTIQFRAEGSNAWLTVFARKGSKIVLVDQEILETLEVGTINQLFFNTNLYSQLQYAAVKAKTWADKAFVMNVA
jgi:hypothetical protein